MIKIVIKRNQIQTTSNMQEEVDVVEEGMTNPMLSVVTNVAIIQMNVEARKVFKGLIVYKKMMMLMVAILF